MRLLLEGENVFGMSNVDALNFDVALHNLQPKPSEYSCNLFHIMSRSMSGDPDLKNFSSNFIVLFYSQIDVGKSLFLMIIVN